MPWTIDHTIWVASLTGMLLVTMLTPVAIGIVIGMYIQRRKQK